MTTINQARPVEGQCGHCFGQDGEHYEGCAKLYWTEERLAAEQKARKRSSVETDVPKLELK